MGRATGAIVGLEYQHLEAMARSQGAAAEAPQAAAHNDQIRIVLGVQGRSFALPFSVQPGARGRAIRCHAVDCRGLGRNWWRGTRAPG